jgi:hypothetical protein
LVRASAPATIEADMPIAHGDGEQWLDAANSRACRARVRAYPTSWF